MKSWGSLVLSLLLLGSSLVQVHSALSCVLNAECETKLRSGSRCVEGFCSNPFVQGCLKTLMANFTEIRACNSDDDPDSGHCIPTLDFAYPEIRIHNGNWESSIFYAWILQILLMEVLRVPTTVGLTTETTAASGFYSSGNTLEYSAKAYPFSSLLGARDCKTTPDECAHVLPEVWNGQYSEWTAALNEGYIEPVEGNGQVGKGSWYVPAFSAQNDDSLVSFYGLQGEGNRQKLAKAFLRPTTWLEYCEEVSPNKCETADKTAQHYPAKESQQSMYFAPGVYTGHFRATPQNNCTMFPETCLGNIVGPGCSWSTNVDAQLYWNDIHLKPDGPLQPNGGYEYGSLIQIWRAANATNSNVILWWWRPEALVEEFHGTDAQFQQMLLPEATDLCSRSRVDTEERCSEDIMERRGDPLGACDQEAHALQKIFSKTLSEQNLEPAASRSPGYDFIKALKITDLEINNLLRRWIAQGVDPYGNDAREAVCGWVADNFDTLVTSIPSGYPKVLSPRSSYNAGFLYAAIAVAGVCMLAVLAVAGLAYYWRKSKVFVYAQAHMVHMILFGFLLITIGAILMALEPTSSICVAQTWLVNLGYTIELVPLLVKIAAINKILSSASKMKRVKISRQGMIRNVGIVICVVIVFLIVWTAVDPSDRVEKRVVPDEQGNVVEGSMACSSEYGFWVLIALTWQALLLLTASVLAFQSKDIIQEFNESRKLGTMIYSQMLFLILRGMVYLMGTREIFRPNTAAAVTSFLLSFDAFLAMSIYLIPKCLEAKVAPTTYTSRGNMRTSHAVHSIEQRAAQARASYLSNTSNFTESSFQSSYQPSSNARRLSYVANSGSTIDTSQRIAGSSGVARLRINNMSQLKEESCEEAEALDRKSSHTNKSFGIDELGDEMKDGSPVRGRPAFKRKSSGSSFKRQSSESLTLAGLVGCFNELDDDHDEDDEDSYNERFDTGGPRFTNARVNEELERSIRQHSTSTPEFKFYCQEDDVEGGLGHMSSPNLMPRKGISAENQKWMSSDILVLAILEEEELGGDEATSTISDGTS